MSEQLTVARSVRAIKGKYRSGRTITYMRQLYKYIARNLCCVVSDALDSMHDFHSMQLIYNIYIACIHNKVMYICIYLPLSGLATEANLGL